VHFYIQEITTTAIYIYTALFGVYGLLAIDLMLFSIRHIVKIASWADRLLKRSLCGLNGELMAMTFFSLVPSGFNQFYYAVKHGLWCARSHEVVTANRYRLFMDTAWARSNFRSGWHYLIYFFSKNGLVSFFQKVKLIR